MSWQKLQGHDAPLTRIAAAMKSGRLAHAYLFVGPTGVGKKRFAIELAKALLCEVNVSEFDACDACSACKLVDADTHPDLVVTGKAADVLEFSIEQMRQLVYDLSLKPARGRKRIAIVDDADDFNDASANCFLKTLEEPPPGSLLILLGSSSAIQLPTIRSRCQIVPFDALPDAVVEEQLRAAGVEDADQLRSLLRLAAGSPGQAVTLSDSTLWPGRQQFLETIADGKPDGPALAKAWMACIEAAGKEPARMRGRSAQLVRLALDVLRLALDTALGRPLASSSSIETSLLQRTANKFGVDGLVARIERMLEAEHHIDRRVPTIVLIESAIDAMMLDAPPTLRPMSLIGV